MSTGGSRAFVVAALLLFASPAVAEVPLADGVTFLGLEAPREAAVGTELTVTAHIRTTGPTARPYLLFVHGQLEGSNEGCQLVADVEPAGPASTEWSRGELAVRAHLGDAGRCGTGLLEVRAGLFHTDSGERLAVLEGAGDHDRVLVARIPVRPEGAAVDLAEIRHEPDPTPPPPPALEAPPSVWGLGLFSLAVIVAALVLRRFGFPGVQLARTGASPTWRSRVGLLLPVGLLAAGVACCLGYVKDDAYISFRYAHNLVVGQGLVFNEGERVEGITNFLWTMLLAPFEAAGADLLQVCNVLGPLLSLVLLVVVARASVVLDGVGRGGSHLWGATWLASSSSLSLWAVGGLEQSLAALLPVAGALVTWEGVRGQGRGGRKVVGGALCLAAACLVRPESHAIAIAVGCALAVVAARDRGPALRALLLWAAVVLAVLVPYHIFRLAYFGSLLPNTYLVKAVSGVDVWCAGTHLVADLLLFNLTGVVVALAAASLLVARARGVRALIVCLGLFFLVYVAKVGTDELMWHRLYLPVLPFVVVAAASALRMVVEVTARERLGRFAFLLGWGVVALGCWHNLAFTYRETGGPGGGEAPSGLHHPDLGKFLTRHSRPGELVAFQDMGSTPYHAPDLRFLDLIGLVDRDVAGLLQEHGVHPFVGGTRARRGGEHCAAFRDHVLGRRPEWIVLVPYPTGEAVDSTAEDFLWMGQEEALRRNGAFRSTLFDCRIYYDPRFAQRYVHVRTWQRSSIYYMSAFRRRDLWERPPAEALLDAPPQTDGPEATFEGGLCLLGAEVESAVVPEGHEVFVTSWWRLPDPPPGEVVFFVQLTRRPAEGSEQVAFDHVPGDWMYPSSRWEAGQLLEDRTLFQLPPEVPPGHYDVRIGVYDRAAGRRWTVAGGVDSDANRVLAGTLRVRQRRPLRDHLVRPTDVAEQRRRMPAAPPAGAER